MEKACVALQKTAQPFRRQGDETKDLQQLPALETNKDSKELEPSANIPHKIWKKQQCRKAWKRSKQLGKQQKSFLDVIMQDMTLEDAYYYMNHFHDLEQRIEVLAQRQVPCCTCVTARCLGLLCGCWPDLAESTSFQAGNYLHRNGRARLCKILASAYVGSGFFATALPQNLQSFSGPLRTVDMWLTLVWFFGWIDFTSR